MAVPVALHDALFQLRHYDEQVSVARQAEIDGFIADAAAWVERYTGHILEAREVTEHFGLDPVDMFLRLRAWPVKPDAVPIASYVEDDGSVVPFVGPQVDVRKRPARVIMPRSNRWSAFLRRPTITVTVRAGYEPDDVVPGNFRRAMLILIAAYDDDREGGEGFARAEASARSLCGDYRMRRV